MTTSQSFVTCFNSSAAGQPSSWASACAAARVDVIDGGDFVAAFLEPARHVGAHPADSDKSNLLRHISIPRCTAMLLAGRPWRVTEKRFPVLRAYVEGAKVLCPSLEDHEEKLNSLALLEFPARPGHARLLPEQLRSTPVASPERHRSLPVAPLTRG